MCWESEFLLCGSDAFSIFKWDHKADKQIACSGVKVEKKQTIYLACKEK